MCNIRFFIVCLIFFSATFQSSLQNSTDVDYVHSIAINLLELSAGSEIPPLIVDLLRGLPQDVKDILKDKPLYELSKEQMATLPVPLLYLLPRTELYNLSGYQHAMLVRSRPAILSLADLAVSSMEDPDVKAPFLRSLQKAHNLTAPVLDALGRSIAEWKSTEIEFEMMYDAGDPLALHLPLPLMMNMSSKLRGEMMFYLRTWLWSDFPYRGANIIRWFQQPWSVRRMFTKLCVEENYPAPLAEWKYNHVEGFSHLLPTMTMAEFSQINLKERYMYKTLLNAPLNTLQIRYLFESMYTEDQLYYVEFQEFAHFLSALQPQHLNRFMVNATDFIHTKFHLNNMTYATAKQIREIIKVQVQWSPSSAEYTSDSERLRQELSSLGRLLYTESTDDLAKLDPSHVNMNMLAALDSSKLTFPQAFELGHLKANITLASPLFQILPQTIPALTLQEIEPKNLPYDDLLHLLRLYPGTQEAFTATLMDRLRSNLGIGHLEQILQNPHRNKLLKFLPAPESPAKLYSMLSQLYSQPLFRPLIDQIDSSLVRSIMPAQVSYKMYIKDQFLFKGITCAHINIINTYELVVFAQDYFNYIKSTSMAHSLTKQSMVCWFARLHKYLREKSTSSLLDKIDSNDLIDGENKIDRLTRHELRAFGDVLIIFRPEEMVTSRYLDRIVEMMGRMPREYLDVMKSRGDYEVVLRGYFEKSLNNTDMIPMEEILTAGNLTHYIPAELLSKVDPRAFKMLVETKLIDTRVCGNAEYRRQMEELIVKAFGHVSTWTPDILVLLKDFLLSLSEEQMDQIPTKSWTGMADLISTSYREPAQNEHGVVDSFYRMCMTRMNNETEAQDYLKSVSGLIQFYLVKIQLHLNSIKSVDEIMAQQLAASVSKPANFKPTTIDDDEMNTLLILEPYIGSHEFEDDTTSASTTTESTTEESLNDNYKVIENNVKTNGSVFNFWDVFINPINESKQDTSTMLTVQNESITTMATFGKKESSTSTSRSSRDSSELDSMEKYEASDEDFFKSSEEEIPIESMGTSSEEIIELDDSISMRNRKNDVKIPCEGECMAVFENKSNLNPTDERRSSENEISTTQEPETDTNINIGNNKFPSDVDQIIDVSSNKDNTDQNQTDTFDETKCPELRYHSTTISSEKTLAHNHEVHSVQKQSTLSMNQDNTTNITHPEMYHPRESTLNSEQNKDVIVSDLSKWNQNHEEKIQNESQTDKIKTNIQPGNTRHKKENSFENYIETTQVPMTKPMFRSADEQTTLYTDHENSLISKMPNLPYEDSTLENQENETTKVNKNNENLFDDGYLINPEDRAILERKVTEIESTNNEINTKIEDMSVTATTYNTEASNRIPTDTVPLETETTDKTKVYQETTSIKYESHEDSVNEERELRLNNSSETNLNNSEENNEERSIEKYDNSQEDPNQHENKLTDELLLSQPNSYESKNTNDENDDSINIDNKEYDNNESTFKEKTNNYPADHYSDNRSNNEYLNKFMDGDMKDSDNHYPPDLPSVQSEERDKDSNEYDRKQFKGKSTSSQLKNFEKKFKNEEKSDEFLTESHESGKNTETSSQSNNYKDYSEEINSNIDREDFVKKENTSENEDRAQSESTITSSEINPSFIEDDTNRENREESVAIERERNINASQSNMNKENNNEIKDSIEEENTILTKSTSENKIVQTETTTTPSEIYRNYGEDHISKNNTEISGTTEKEINTDFRLPTSIEENNEEINTSIEEHKKQIENETENQGKSQTETIKTSSVIMDFKESNGGIISTPNEDTSTQDMVSRIETTLETHDDANENGTDGNNNIDLIQNEQLEEKRNRIFDESEEQNSEIFKPENNTKYSLNYLTNASTQKNTDETTFENNEYKSKAEIIDDSSYLEAITESMRNKFDENSGERSNLLSISRSEETTKISDFTSTYEIPSNNKHPDSISSISRSEETTKTSDFSLTSEIPSNYKHPDFISLTLKLDHDQNKISNINNSEINIAYRRVDKELDEFVVYDIPDDVTPQDIKQEDSDGDSHSKSRNNKSLLSESEEISTDFPEVGKATSSDHEILKDKFLELNKGIKDMNKYFELNIFDVTDELSTRLRKRSIRRRRFLINDDNLNPRNMIITCEALNLLGTITDVISMENIIVKLNKESLLDCLDLVNGQQVSRRTKAEIINKYYKNIDKVLPILGNTLTDLTLEEIRGLNMNVWSLEILNHMNSINDTKKAQLIVEKYLKKVKRNVLNLNEMVILNNMLCYLSENILRKSLDNIKPTQLLSIMKHIDTCSPKCLTTFSSLVLNSLGSPMHWKYEQVYHLGTVPSGLNETMWNEFIQQNHLKFNMNEKIYKCLSEDKVSSINIAVLEEYRRVDNSGLYGISGEEQDYASGSTILSGGMGSLFINMYIIQFIVRRYL